MACLIFGCAKSDGEHYERGEKIMGTLVTLKADGKNSRAAVDESFEKIFELVEKIKTDLKRLEDSAGKKEFVKISPEVFEMLSIAQKYSELTDGAFDVTIAPAVDVWKIAGKNKILPTDEEISAAKNLVDFRRLSLRESDGSAMLEKSGMRIDLGGIAKGYGADLARKIFAEKNIRDGLIDFGTSTIFAFGKKNIGIKNPRQKNELSEILEIENSAIATSGDYEKFFVLDGRRYHHIIDPKTCRPTENKIASVTILVSGNEKNCATAADILSTSIFVLGEERGRKILEQLPDAKIINLAHQSP